MNLREELDAIREQYGQLTPTLVLDEARDPGHPLHNRFEWDDSVAAERYRLEQAHKLIVSVRYKPRTSDEDPIRELRAYHAVNTPDGVDYTPAEQVARNPLLREMVLRDMQREWKQLRDRYQAFTEFVDMVRRDIGDAAA